ncbi:MAG: flavodoxin family protein [Alphaproteobacteria bacterium]|nr:MAG: flavodoxin family protein [Alphaproteobacteria bacterium]
MTNMRTVVVYYSNTGNTRRIAEQIAAGLGAELAEVTCERYLRWYGPAAMAWDIFTRHIPMVDVVAPAHAEYDVVVFGGPVWAARPAPPILALAGRWPTARKALFVTCSGASPNSPPETAIAEMQQVLAGGSEVPSAIFRQVDMDSSQAATLARAFASGLASALASSTAGPK